MPRTKMASRLKREDHAAVARNTRSRELELAFELQGNELCPLQREVESAAESAHDRARLWAASKSDTSFSGGARYYDISYGGTGASQPGVLNSLATNVFGYTKVTPSETTAAPTAGGYEGSQGSQPSRQLYHMNLYDSEETVPISPAGVPVAKVMASGAGALGRDAPPTVSPVSLRVRNES